MPPIYVDTSVVTVWLFGEKREATRYAATQRLFELIAAGNIEGLISLYTPQEVYAFCEDNFPPDEVRATAKLALRQVLLTELEIAPLLKRTERLIHQRRFPLADTSDLPHAVVAYLNHCQVIVTYDEHFAGIGPAIKVYTPEEFLVEWSGR
jgi:predicted nucleic acid-binding protein